MGRCKTDFDSLRLSPGDCAGMGALRSDRHKEKPKGLPECPRAQLRVLSTPFRTSDHSGR